MLATKKWNDYLCSNKRSYFCERSPTTIICPTLSVLSHGNVSVTPMYGTVNIYGSYVDYQCNGGYKLNGPSYIECQSDGTWSGNIPTCEEILCPTLSPLQHGSLFYSTMDGLANSIGSYVRYNCDKDYYVNGIRRLQTEKRYCMPDGTWSGIEVNCKAILCPTLSPLQNGSITNITSDGPTNKYGSVVEYTCDKGYLLNGNALLHIVKRYCQSDGTWGGNEPTCEARLSPGKGGLDVILLVDVSSIIGERSMKMAKQLMKQLVDNFGVSNETSGGTHGTRFALMTFGFSATVVFNLNDRTARSKTEVKKRIDGLQNTGGATDLRTVFSQMFDKVFRPVIYEDQRRFTDANRAIVLLTDTEETNTSLKRSAIRFAHFLKKDLNFEIYCIGVGKDMDHSSLAEIASKPQLEHVFTLSEFKNPEKVGDIIAEKNIVFDYGRCGVSGNTDRYFRSQRTNEGAWPWLGWFSVLDDENISQTCGGAILCDRWFVTTASCVSKKRGDQVVPYKTSMMNVYLSDYDLLKKDTHERRPIVQRVIIHDNYTGEEIGNLGIYENDVALLDFGQNEAERPVLDKYLRPICIATDNVSLSAAVMHFTTLPSNRTAFIAGWGYAPDNIYHERQEMMQATILSVQKECSHISKKSFDLEGFFCVYQSPSCMADIGGPYMAQMSDKRFYSLGLALKRSNQWPEHCIFLNLLHKPVSEWITHVLDGCNRVKNKDT